METLLNADVDADVDMNVDADVEMNVDADADENVDANVDADVDADADADVSIEVIDLNNEGSDIIETNNSIANYKDFGMQCGSLCPKTDASTQTEIPSERYFVEHDVQVDENLQISILACIII